MRKLVISDQDLWMPRMRPVDANAVRTDQPVLKPGEVLVARYSVDGMGYEYGAPESPGEVKSLVAQSHVRWFACYQTGLSWER